MSNVEPKALGKHLVPQHTTCESGPQVRMQVLVLQTCADLPKIASKLL